MGFCKNCGSEHGADAFVCIKCGCLIDGYSVKKTTLQTNKTNEALKILSLIFSIISIAVWLAYIFSGRLQWMYEWAFWLSFSLTSALTVCGLCFGILTKDKLGYCLNTAAFVFILFLMLSIVIS